MTLENSDQVKSTPIKHSSTIKVRPIQDRITRSTTILNESKVSGDDLLQMFRSIKDSYKIDDLQSKKLTITLDPKPIQRSIENSPYMAP